MPPIAYTCPKCRAVMRTANPVPAGKSIRCLRCKNVFAPGRPAAASPGAAAAAPMRPPSPPIQRGRPSAPGIPQRQLRKSRRIGFLACCLLLLGAVLGGGYFLWSSYGHTMLAQLGLSSSNPTRTEVAKASTSKENTGDSTSKQNTGGSASKENTGSPAVTRQEAAPLDALAYIPGESNLIAGIGLGTLLARPAVAALLEPALKQDPDMKMFQDIEKATGVGFKDMCDQTIAGMKIPLGPAAAAGPEHITAVYLSKSPFKPEQLIPVVSDGPARKINGQEWYPSKRSPPFTWVSVPNKRLLVFTNVPEDRLATVFTGDGRKPLLDPEAVKLVRRVDKSQLWVAVPIDEAARKELEKNLQPLQETIPPDLKPAFDALLTARGLAMWGGIQGGQVKLTLGVACADSKGARDATASLQGAWEKMGKPALDAAQVKDVVENLPPYLQTTVKELVGNIQIKQEDTLVQLGLQVSAEPLETLAREAMANPAMLAEAFKPAPPGTINLNKEKAELLKLTGELRSKNQLPAHKPNQKLDQAALAYAQKMAKQGKLDPVVDVQLVANNAQVAGYQFQVLNAAIAGGPEVTAQGVMKVWNDTKDVLQLILDKQFDEIGVGVARDEKGATYYVQVYATPQK